MNSTPSTQPQNAPQPEFENLKDQAREQAETAEQKGRAAKNAATQMAAETGRQVTAKAKEVADTMRTQAGQTGERLKERGLAYLDTQKSHLSSEIQAFSHAARKASKRLEEESDTNLAGYVANAADYLEDAGRRLKEKDLRSLSDDLEDAVRRHPEIVFGGLFIVGLALTRFLKASKPSRRQRYGRGQPYDEPPFRGETSGRPATGYGRPHSSRTMPPQPAGLPASTHETHSQGSTPASDSPTITAPQSSSSAAEEKK